MQTKIVEVVVVADHRVFDDRVQSIDDILPDSLATDLLGLLHIRSQAIPLEIVVDNHIPLVAGYTGSLPGEPFRRNDGVVERRTHQDAADARPELSLFVQGLSLTQPLHLLFKTKDLEQVSDHLDCVT